MLSGMKIGLLVAALLFVGESTSAQSKKRLQPGKLYEPGQKIYAPRFGFETVVPVGWNGTLPRESEIFLLTPQTINVGGEIFTFQSAGTNLENIRAAWLRGTNLSETIIIKAKDSVSINGDMIAAEVISEGEGVNKGYKGYAIARCGPFGHCISSLGIGPIQFFDQIKTAVTSFMTSAAFSQPSNVSVYVDFNWKEFLTGKQLVAFAAMEGGSKENTVHLCPDGSFTAVFDKTGIFKEQNAQYKGKQAGTWTAEGVGEQGKLQLKFNKLPEAEISLSIKDEQISANGERYFAAESDKCK
jgi:hypothetical protein